MVTEMNPELIGRIHNDVVFTKADLINARRWFLEENGKPLVGRMPNAVLEAWYNDGAKEFDFKPDIAATIFYRARDTRGRFNGGLKQRDVFKHELNQQGRGRPSTYSYINASGLTRENSDIKKIVTGNGAIHIAVWDDFLEEYELSWQSKSDQKDVIVALLKALDAYRTVAVDLGADVSEIDAEMNANEI